MVVTKKAKPISVRIRERSKKELGDIIRLHPSDPRKKLLFMKMKIIICTRTYQKLIELAGQGRTGSWPHWQEFGRNYS